MVVNTALELSGVYEARRIINKMSDRQLVNTHFAAWSRLCTGQLCLIHAHLQHLVFSVWVWNVCLCTSFE